MKPGRENENTAATALLGGFLVPQWLINGESPPAQIPRWGERIEGVRMYDSQGDPDEYNDIRWGHNEEGRIVMAVDGDCGCGYAFVDLLDLLEWARGREIE